MVQQQQRCLSHGGGPRPAGDVAKWRSLTQCACSQVYLDTSRPMLILRACRKLELRTVQSLAPYSVHAVTLREQAC